MSKVDEPKSIEMPDLLEGSAAHPPHSKNRVIRIQGIPAIDAMRNVLAAKKGDPGALREILAQLSKFLRGKSDLPREYAHFLSDALEEFTNHDIMKAAGDYYRERVVGKMKEGYSDIEEEVRAEDEAEKLSDEQIHAIIMLKLTSEVREGKVRVHLPEKPIGSGMRGWTGEATRSAIGRAFCKAFKITPSKEQSRSADASFYISKIRQLLRFGESQTRSIEIVRSAVEESDRKSETQIRSWLKEENIPDETDIKTYQHKKINLGLIVCAYVEAGFALDDACSMVSRAAVWGIVGLPDASIFLKPMTMEAAYDLARKTSK